MDPAGLFSKIEEFKHIVVESEKAHPHSSFVCFQLFRMHESLDTQTVQTPIAEETSLLTEPVLDEGECGILSRKTDHSQHTLLSEILAPFSDPVSEDDEDEVSFEDVLKMDEETKQLLSKEDL